MTKRTLKLQGDQVTFNCPYCTGRVTTGTSEDDRPTIIHTIPPCKAFNEVQTADDILRIMKAAGSS